MALEPFLGEISLWPCNFAPRGYAFCEGQLLSIAQNTALFSLIGNYYGGDGRSTFALPDLRGRTVIGAGTGPGLSTHELAESGGTESVPLQPFTAAPATLGTPVSLSAFPADTATLPVVQPYITMHYIIATYGVYPSRE